MHIYTPTPTKKISPCPISFYPVSAGFPSPAEDYDEHELDLHEHVVQHPAATFFIRAQGTSMINAGIHPNDILVVDKSLTPYHNNIIIALLNGEFTVKRLYKQKDIIKLVPENNGYTPIMVTPDDDFHIWGVVTYVVHQAV